MNTLKPIYWHQGLFLKPHHFQYLQAYQQQDALVVKENLEPYFWGVSKLDIDKKELLNKNFLIQNLELIFMDGTVVNLPDNALLKSRSFEKLYNDMLEDLKVYVGIKSFTQSELNVTQLDSYENLKNIDTRFISKKDAIKVNNLYHEDESADVQFMDYYLKIFFEDEIEDLNSYQIIPLAKIKKQSEQVVLSDSFTPPLLNIKVDANFFEIIKIIQKDLTSHAFQLQEYKLPLDSLADEPNYLKYITALQALSNYLPKLNHMLKTPNIHPWHYYGIFTQIIGILSTFSTRVNIFGKSDSGNYLIQEYDHLNLYECFNEIRLLISELLDGIIIGPDYILAFNKDETSFTLDCPVTIFHAKYRYYLVLKTPTQTQRLQESFVSFAKIATSTEIESIVQRSLPGLPFEIFNFPIQGLPQRENSVYLELMTEDSHWASILQAQNIAIEFDDALDDVTIELVVLKK
ncbi:MAG: type VI secretion system baseplate subunit TssK [Campylobacterota bacterium]|nr:type VI secretion system baseplate subunit TssK [Campylobacterota bacterium]